ncbi:hypothetical protein [Paenibacillus lautus]|nr:hypothetical protein [Paenibacillus lautus]
MSQADAVKDTENRVVYYSKQSMSTKSFVVGGAKIKWKSSYQTTPT